MGLESDARRDNRNWDEIVIVRSLLELDRLCKEREMGCSRCIEGRLTWCDCRPPRRRSGEPRADRMHGRADILEIGANEVNQIGLCE